MPKILDLTGHQFERLTVVKYTGKTTYYGSKLWLCECSCSNKTRIEVKTSHLRSGNTKSCGCLRKEAKGGPIIHGECKKGEPPTVLYSLWSSIKNRCFYKKDKYYHRYVGRGISVYKPWRYNFILFAEYVKKLDNCPSENILKTRGKGKIKGKLTLDRIDNDKNYEPGNLRWISHKAQNNNRENNVYVVYKNKRMTLAEAVDKYSVIKYSTVYSRFKKQGWTLEKSLKHPLRKK